MSLHPSLRLGKSGVKSLKNVMKRFERVRYLMERGKWSDGRSVYGLPKIRQVKVKVSKAAPKEEGAKTDASTEKPTTETPAS